MAHTFTNLLVHVVFSTKDRQPWIDAELHGRLLPYMGGIVRELNGSSWIIGGTADHVHGLWLVPTTMALADMMRVVKTNSSRWVHEQYPHKEFGWQAGYGAFSVSQSASADVRTYIERQAEHHRKLTFQEEFLAFLKRHGIEYDERYIWE